MVFTKLRCASLNDGSLVVPKAWMKKLSKLVCVFLSLSNDSELGTGSMRPLVDDTGKIRYGTSVTGI